MKSKKHDLPEPVDYKTSLHALQIELKKLQASDQEHLRILPRFESRDASGKDKVIKRVTEYLRPRDIRVVALGKSSDRDTHSNAMSLNCPRPAKWS